jgi:glycosyltransferase involved in cell wall biosynthesis
MLYCKVAVCWSRTIIVVHVGDFEQTGVVESASMARPKVSVCMATWNGERYIEQQLRSVLPQLQAGDEVVVIDDVSSDSTLDRIHSMGSDLIRVIRHTENGGVVVSFEDALRHATGDILFLCDQDDIWAPDKVSKVLSAFAAHPDANIVAHNVALIDEHGAPLDGAWYVDSRRFASGLLANLKVNRFQGSAIALRASLLPKVLPFPRNKQFIHDVWIGMRNHLTGGKAVHIDEPLLLYRRHSLNASTRYPFLRQLSGRIQLAFYLLRSMF